MTNVDVQLDESEKLRFREFLRRHQQMVSRRLLQDGTKILLKITGGRDVTPSFVAHLPDEELVRSFLLDFRFFYLEKEPTNFLALCKLLKRRIPNSNAQVWLEELKEQFTGAMSKRAFEIKVNGEVLDARRLMDLWLNAHYFHADERKSPALTKACDLLGIDACKFLLLDGVYEAAKAVSRLATALKGLDS